jgi:hypothetical protein
MEEARKVIVVVAKVEREENKAMMNVQQMLYGNAGKGDRVDNGLKIETVKKTRRKGAIPHGTFTLVV